MKAALDRAFRATAPFTRPSNLRSTTTLISVETAMRREFHPRLAALLSCFLMLIYLSGCAVTSTGASGSVGGSSGGGSGSGGGNESTAPAPDKDLKTDVVASHLETPWSMAFASDGRLFFTEQPGRVRVITSSGLAPTPVLDLTKVTVGGEGGTTGMDLDPDFAR